jgi:hypothetical protein
MPFFPASASAQQAITGGHPDSLGNNALRVSLAHVERSVDKVLDTRCLLDDAPHYALMISGADVTTIFGDSYFLEVFLGYRAQHNGD